MPKILKEADNFSSFTWKDLPQEALAFIYKEYFNEQMSLDEYVAAYYGNKISGIKHEADKLFEEAKEKSLDRGDFPEELVDVWTKKIIPKDSDNASESNIIKVRTKPVSRDKNEAKRTSMTRQIQQKEDQQDELSHLNRRFEERSDEFLSATRSCFAMADELLSQVARHDSQTSSYDQSVLLEVQQNLQSISNRQLETLESNCRGIRVSTEAEIEQLYQERNKLAW